MRFVPFTEEEVRALVETVLRRKAPQTLDAAVQVADLRLDPATRRVTRRVGDGAQEVRLGPVPIPGLMALQRVARSRGLAHPPVTRFWLLFPLRKW